jgi:hypothetical protein
MLEWTWHKVQVFLVSHQLAIECQCLVNAETGKVELIKTDLPGM